MKTKSGETWAECREAVVRDMPFLVMASDSVLVGVGYVQDDTDRYLIALDPNLCSVRRRGASELITPVDRALGGENVALIKALTGGSIHIDDHVTRLKDRMIPGTVVLRVKGDSVPCLFIHGLQRDGKALSKRVAGILKGDGAEE